MVTHQGGPQTPGGRIRALGFARMGARGRRRGPIAGYVYTMLPSDAGRAHPRPLESTHWGFASTRTQGRAVAARGPTMCQYQGSPVSDKTTILICAIIPIRPLIW